MNPNKLAVLVMVIQLFAWISLQAQPCQEIMEEERNCWTVCHNTVRDIYDEYVETNDTSFLVTASVKVKICLACPSECLSSTDSSIQAVNNLREIIEAELERLRGMVEKAPDAVSPLLQQDTDPDNDGIPSSRDRCPRRWGTGIRSTLGCPDKDRDEVLDWNDICPHTPFGTRVNKEGCPDDDGDGIRDSLDQCRQTSPGTLVNNVGCQDNDQDGVTEIDSRDRCPNTPLGVHVNREGCQDDDRDEVANKMDLCPNTPLGVPVNANGCIDRDRDGITEWRGEDQCPNTPFHCKNVSSRGCCDSDDDGVENRYDKCKFEAGSVDAFGCPDRDEDKVPDYLDVCPDLTGETFLSGCLLPTFELIEEGVFTFDRRKKDIAGFEMSKGEVTQALWKAVMGYLPDRILDGYCGDCPIIQVSVAEVQQFIRKLNQASGDNYRLPWFSEWLYAAWEGRRCPHSFSGSDELGNVGWYKENSRGQLPVGRRLDANDFELYDMSGGVWEYVQWEKKFSRDSYGKYVAIGCSFISSRQECHWTDSSVTLVNVSREEEDRKKGRSIGFRLVRE